MVDDAEIGYAGAVYPGPRCVLYRVCKDCGARLQWDTTARDALTQRGREWLRDTDCLRAS
jgi:hypothetical protein